MVLGTAPGSWEEVIASLFHTEFEVVETASFDALEER